MSREILFRGKRLDNGKWVFGYYVRHAETDYIYTGKVVEGNHLTEYGLPCADVELYAVDPATVEQYTGMTDRNGKKIFEGDLIMASTFGFNTEHFVTEVVFMDRAGMRGFSLKNGRALFYFGQKDLNKMDDADVIGNRWDNPELLGVYRIDA